MRILKIVLIGLIFNLIQVAAPVRAQVPIPGPDPAPPFPLPHPKPHPRPPPEPKLTAQQLEGFVEPITAKLSFGIPFDVGSTKGFVG